MDCKASFLPYGQTGYFSKIILDYLEQKGSIQPFYKHQSSIEGIKAAIEDRKKFSTDRKLLVSVLQKQYADIHTSELVTKNIVSLINENTFTVCTAHQPNIFTGPLFFIYKILHAVKLAEELKTLLPENNFVPVYYMGSEDADLDELGHIYLDAEKYEWKTDQKGAVGRMKVDKNLVKLIDIFSGRISVHEHGAEIIGLMKECYTEGATIERATFQLADRLFSIFGLVTILPDNPDLKAGFKTVIEKELLHEFSHLAVQETVSEFPEDYKVQASGRELNMFYLVDDKRERIEIDNTDPAAVKWTVLNTTITFTKEALIEELNVHPERFSPNVILRPVFQEWILPGIAFIGGGGEIAYWLQLKKVFEAVGVPYPLLILRNSFMFVNTEIKTLADKLNIALPQLFQPELTLINQLVKRDSEQQLTLENERMQLTSFYENIGIIAGKIDATLGRHTEALQTQALKKITALEKKMLRAEKRKFDAEQRKLQKIKDRLFPNNNLQERIDNLMPYYGYWGKEFIRMIYDHSKGLAQEFGILVEAGNREV